MGPVRRPLLALAMVGAPLLAQTGTLRGQVTHQGRPVAWAQVILHDREAGRAFPTRTGADGWFQVSTLPPGGYHVQVQANGLVHALARPWGEVLAGHTTRCPYIPMEREGVIACGILPASYLEDPPLGSVLGRGRAWGIPLP